jgi:hypothetical protein
MVLKVQQDMQVMQDKMTAQTASSSAHSLAPSPSSGKRQQPQQQSRRHSTAWLARRTSATPLSRQDDKQSDQQPQQQQQLQQQQQQQQGMAATSAFELLGDDDAQVADYADLQWDEGDFPAGSTQTPDRRISAAAVTIDVTSSQKSSAVRSPRLLVLREDESPETTSVRRQTQSLLVSDELDESAFVAALSPTYRQLEKEQAEGEGEGEEEEEEEEYDDPIVFHKKDEQSGDGDGDYTAAVAAVSDPSDPSDQLSGSEHDDDVEDEQEENDADGVKQSKGDNDSRDETDV